MVYNLEGSSYDRETHRDIVSFHSDVFVSSHFGVSTDVSLTLVMISRVINILIFILLFARVVMAAFS
jgi:hypothetical protein